VGQTLRGVLFVGAHPDDETIMAGGTLALLASQGVPVHVVCATDGRGGEAGGVPEAATPDDRARVRESELRCAVAALGINDLTLLGYEDPLIGPGEELFGFAADDAALTDQITRLIQAQPVDVVLSHGSNGEYGHPAHIQVHRAVQRAVRENTPDVIFYSVAARVPQIMDRIWNTSDPAHLALDIRPWAEAKLAAMECHRTQHELFKRRRKLQTVREAIRFVESFHRHWPDRGTPDDAFAAQLVAAGAWRPKTNLVLWGFMGTGKTTVGRLVAEQLDMDFVDADDVIVARAGRSIAEIFAQEGEAAFRQIEAEVCAELARGSGQVIATGGGALLNNAVYRAFEASSLVVCLTCDLDEIIRRVGIDPARPLFSERAHLARLLAERAPAYARIPHTVDTTGRSPQQVSEEVISLWHI
jgi:shikimate kinase/LmbE family N-acetylglucosaminyl deacetylase